MVKYNIKTVNDWLYNSNPIKGMYYNGRKVYRRFVANGQPTPPAFEGKWKATYQDSHVESAQCGSSSAIVQNEINLSNLVSVEIGDCVTSIGESAFYNCRSLTSVTIPNSVTSIRNWVFQNCRSLTSCTIGSGVTSIGEQVFDSCFILTRLNSDVDGVFNIPSGVTSIGGRAFQNCGSLQSITIPSGVTTIGQQTFNGCSGLTSINIPNGVTTINWGAFNNCTSLQSITINAITPPTIGYGVFNNTNNCPIYVPSESVNAYKAASGWSSYTSRIKPISEKPQ